MANGHVLEFPAQHLRNQIQLATLDSELPHFLSWYWERKLRALCPKQYRTPGLVPLEISVRHASHFRKVWRCENNSRKAVLEGCPSVLETVIFEDVSVAE